MRSPQQKFFSDVLIVCNKLYPNIVYDGKLPLKANYPFIYVGEQASSEVKNKSYIGLVIEQTVHIYSDKIHERGSVTAIMDTLTVEMRKKFQIDVSDYQVLPDDTTDVPLIHGILTFRFENL